MATGDSVSNTLLAIEGNLTEHLKVLEYGPPITHIYNPLEYAFNTHADFVQKYCQNKKKVLFVGMNPGPYGMAQNGVPFGDTHYVVNWLNVQGVVYKPPVEHPKRPIEGLYCSHKEVSGSRLWGFFEELCIKPEFFFKNCFIHNYCPLVFMTSTGKNVTPAEMKAEERKQMFSICDSSLRDVIKLLDVSVIVGVGRFAEKRAKDVLKTLDSHEIEVIPLLHPSPASPQANHGWSDIAYKQLMDYGLISTIQGI